MDTGVAAACTPTNKPNRHHAAGLKHHAIQRLGCYTLEVLLQPRHIRIATASAPCEEACECKQTATTC